MGVVNRRNAVLGWAVWTAASRMAKREEGKAGKKKSGSSAKAGAAGRKRRLGSAIAFLVALGVGTVAFVRTRASRGGAEPE